MITDKIVRSELERQEKRFRGYARACRELADDLRAGKTLEGGDPNDTPETLEARAEAWEGAAADTNHVLASILARGRSKTPSRAARMRGRKAERFIVDEAIADVQRPNTEQPDLQRPKPCEHVGSCACVPLERM
jgi:hypothetical protein